MRFPRGLKGFVPGGEGFGIGMIGGDREWEPDLDL
jgi:hypothetical protein